MSEILKIIRNLKADAFINKIMDDFQRNVRLNALKNIIKPYRTVELGFLAKQLEVTVQEVKTLLVELILENKIQGKIDQ